MENSSTSLRRQLQAIPGLEKALDGRPLEALQPEEVFTLVKAIPAIGDHNARRIYSDVMRDMFETGRMSQASALVELDDLRNSLNLSREDHHAVLALLQRSAGPRLAGSLLEQEASELRCAAARENIEELMRTSGLAVIDRNGLSASTETALDRLRQSSGLSDDAWESCLVSFGPASDREQQRLQALPPNAVMLRRCRTTRMHVVHNSPQWDPQRCQQWTLMSRSKSWYQLRPWEMQCFHALWRA